ncbi:hypothetical protein SDC9_149129 [bioreactor metagenome]|uniref:Uncharacterized protein n=1 Tax=bioreactor metagenome TaxID=1076179 RepID=A0A645EKD2_9ZZZZ
MHGRSDVHSIHGRGEGDHERHARRLSEESLHRRRLHGREGQGRLHERMQDQRQGELRSGAPADDDIHGKRGMPGSLCFGQEGEVLKGLRMRLSGNGIGGDGQGRRFHDGLRGLQQIHQGCGHSRFSPHTAGGGRRDIRP